MKLCNWGYVPWGNISYCLDNYDSLCMYEEFEFSDDISLMTGDREYQDYFRKHQKYPIF